MGRPASMTNGKALRQVRSKGVGPAYADDLFAIVIERLPAQLSILASTFESIR